MTIEEIVGQGISSFINTLTNTAMQLVMIAKCQAAANDDKQHKMIKVCHEH